MIVPYQRLSPDALAAVIEEYVSRDGTEHTDAELKAKQVRQALEAGELVLVFDAEAESCNLLSPEEVTAAEYAAEAAAEEQVTHEADFVDRPLDEDHIP